MILAPLELHGRYRRSAEKDFSDKFKERDRDKFKERDRDVSCRSALFFFFFLHTCVDPLL